MDLDDVSPENFFKKCTYSSDPDPGNKIVMSNGAFIQSAIWLNIERILKVISNKI